MIPGNVDQHVSCWCVMWPIADLARGGKSSFEVKSHTAKYFITYGATFNHGSGALNQSNIYVLSSTPRF